jgi:hypothetical protein
MQAINGRHRLERTRFTLTQPVIVGAHARIVLQRRQCRQVDDGVNGTTCLTSTARWGRGGRLFGAVSVGPGSDRAHPRYDADDCRSRAPDGDKNTGVIRASWASNGSNPRCFARKPVVDKPAVGSYCAASAIARRIPCSVRPSSRFVSGAPPGTTNRR